MKEANYIALEGNIGVGKTELATLLAEKLDARLILENPEENPFLIDFYKDKERYAFQTQVFFLLSRFKKQEELFEHDLFLKKIVQDFYFGKDRIFASLNLDEREYRLYEKIFPILGKNIPQPDLVIYLQSNPENLYKKLKQKKNLYFEYDYFLALNEAYNRFFFHYDKTPLLVLNMDNFDFKSGSSHLEKLLELLRKPFSGTKYYTHR